MIRTKKIQKIMVSIVLIIILLPSLACASTLKVDLTLDKHTFFLDDIVMGRISVENTGILPIKLYQAEAKFISSDNKVVVKNTTNLSVTVPPGHYSEPFYEVLPDIGPGTYTVVVCLNHSKGFSEDREVIVVKTKEDIASKKIGEAESLLERCENEKLSEKKEMYRINASEYLDKAKDSFSIGEYSIACDYADISIQYSKMALANETPHETPPIDISTKPTLPPINISPIPTIPSITPSLSPYTDGKPVKPFPILLYLCIIATIIAIMAGISLYLIRDMKKGKQ